VALFASLGGTGYAATHIDKGATAAKAKPKAAPKYVTSSQVNKLIGSYLKAHHVGATGPQGPQGPQGTAGTAGTNGKAGAQGPGAQPIDVRTAGEVSGVETTIGPWSLTLDCSNTEGTKTVIDGPGTFTFTQSFGATKAETTSADVSVNGFATGVGNGVQQGMHGFLVSGSTIIELNLETYARKNTAQECGVIGDAIPVPD
jgi:hypothetical protein